MIGVKTDITKQGYNKIQLLTHFGWLNRLKLQYFVIK